MSDANAMTTTTKVVCVLLNGLHDIVFQSYSQPPQAEYTGYDVDC